MNNETREALRAWNRAQAMAAKQARKWYNIEHISAPLQAVRLQLRLQS